MTRTQRHDLYKQMREHDKKRYSGNVFAGMCGLIRSMGYYHACLSRLPELYKQKPSNCCVSDYWWPPCDWVPRNAALDKAIALSAPRPSIFTRIKKFLKP